MAVKSKLLEFSNGKPTMTAIDVLSMNNLQLKFSGSYYATFATGVALDANRTINIPNTNVDLADIATALSTANAALPSASFTASAVTGKLITGYVKGAGVVAATDTILEAINKLAGNADAAASAASTADGKAVTAQGNVDNLVTLSGVAKDSTNLGEFAPGTVISDNRTIKGALSDLDNAVSLLAAGLVYKGAIAGDYDFTAHGTQTKGWFYKISSAGTLVTNTGVPAIAVNIGDMIIINNTATQAAIVDGDLDKIDNTESADILRNTLTSAYIFVGNSSNVATGVAVSGEASISNAGAVTLANSAVIGKVLTGFTSGAGTVAATDTLLEAIQKLNGNITNVASTANAALPSASFTDAAVTGKLITGFSSGAGVVAATDTILQAINKLDGNVAAAQAGSAVTLSSNEATIAANKVVYVGTDGYIAAADAAAIATAEGTIGVTSGGTGNQQVKICGRVTIANNSVNFDIGKRVYLGATGFGTKTAPTDVDTVVVCLGVAVSTTEVILNPQLVVIN